MIRQEHFVARHQNDWRAFECWLDKREGISTTLAGSAVFDDGEFAARYRRLCQQLAIAQQRSYSPAVTEPLQTLVERGHNVLYQTPPPRWARALQFILAGFPQLVRSHARAMWLSAVLLFGPIIGLTVLLQYQPELVHSMFSPAQLGEIEAMYDPSAARFGRDSDRASESDWMMFGYYIFNNVSIGFRSFASGLLFGVGALFILIFNGINIGMVAGHLTVIGYGGPFWRFVVTHGAPELLAIVIAGGAGLQIGMAMIAPGRRSRRGALLEAGKDGAKLCLGVFVMLVMAAFIEAFWSSRNDLPDALRFSVAGVLWLLLLLWLWRGGKGQARAY